DRRDFPRLKDEFQSRLAHVEFLDPDRYDTMQGSLTTHWEELARLVLNAEPARTPLRRFFLTLGIGALLFMSLPAINLVNINLSRILEQAGEIGVRKAFGASRAALVGQFVIENVLLCLVGGAIGLVLSWAVLAAISNGGLIPYAHFTLNPRIFACGLFLATFFGVLSGIYPAWRMSRMHPVAALRGTPR
ncbi:MAG TPA: FtsX-like permease family protein, partial [Candidatus Udaeobacter sp.]|nr:FtsX-like permease family protein [Candidatus Udaeobacter sp.]